MTDLNGKIAVVTGSTTGIGLGISHHLASRGCSVVITGLGSPQMIESIIQEFRSKYTGIYQFVEGNLIQEDSTLMFCQKVLGMFPKGVDILVNNAGIIINGNIDEFPIDKWKDMMAISLTAPFLLTRQFLPKMKEKRWGRIINMSSQMGHVSLLGRAPYSTVKSGIIGFSKGVALEGAPLGITCNAICPGFADAPMGQGPIKDYAARKNISFEEAKAEFILTQNPTQKLITIDQISEMVLYLCSPGADNITGTSLLMDGGFTAK